MTSLEYYIKQIEQFISALTDDIESGEGTVVTQTKLAVYQEVLEHLEEIEREPSGDLISREGTLTAFANYVGSGMSMNDYDALWDIVAKMPAVKQEPKFMAKSDGTIEQVKNCDDCIFKKEWEKIGKLISVVLEKQTEQEPCEDAVSRQYLIDIATKDGAYDYVSAQEIANAPSVNPQPKMGKWIKSRDSYGNNHFTCPFCENDIATKYDGAWKDNYCSNCGARMQEVE